LTVYSRQKAKESWQPARLCRSPAPSDQVIRAGDIILAGTGSQQTRNPPHKLSGKPATQTVWQVRKTNRRPPLPVPARPVRTAQPGGLHHSGGRTGASPNINQSLFILLILSKIRKQSSQEPNLHFFIILINFLFLKLYL
jgi:hypothetical protein